MPDDMDGPATLTAETRALGNKVAQLAHERRLYGIASDALAQAQDEFTEHYRPLIKQVSDANSLVGATEKRIRAMAETTFRADGNKHPHPCVEIKMSKVVSYEPDVALKWATGKGMCLKLDAKAFEALAKAGPANVAGIARVIEEPHAQISRELTTIAGDAGTQALPPRAITDPASPANQGVAT